MRNTTRLILELKIQKLKQVHNCQFNICTHELKEASRTSSDSQTAYGAATRDDPDDPQVFKLLSQFLDFNRANA